MELVISVGMMALCLSSAVLAISSIFTSSWIVSNFAGSKNLGLIYACRQPLGFPEWCGVLENTPTEWMATTCLITAGACVLLAAAICLLLAEYKKKRVLLMWTKMLAAGGMMFLCLATLTFPIGFSMDEVGGSPYKLPQYMKLGSSFGMFITSVVLASISNFMANKTCDRLNFR